MAMPGQFTLILAGTTNRRVLGIELTSHSKCTLFLLLHFETMNLITNLMFKKLNPGAIQRFYRQICHTHPFEHNKVNTFTERTHNCGQLSKDDIGKRVNLFGWIQYTRFNNKIIALRDSYGVTQCIVDPSHLKESFRQKTIYNESVVQVTGIVRARPKGQENDKLLTGQVEVSAHSVKVLSTAKKDLPILARDDQDYTWVNRLKYRYLDLRSHSMQESLRLRSAVCNILRSKLYDLNFVECGTPTLFKRTPGGANEFVVPTQIQNKFYSLTQSPQQLKQLLMIGGLDRYFQICMCYRDESGRSDRQPEFTQLDIELSFTNQNLVMKLVNELVRDLISKLSKVSKSFGDQIHSFDTDTEIETISYHDAFEKYGTDKPDTRFRWLIESHDKDSLRIKIPHIFNEQEVSSMVELIKNEKHLDISKFKIVTKVLDPNNTEMVVDSRSPEARKFLGALRLRLASELERRNTRVYEYKFKFLWVTDFPLFTTGLDGKFEPNHHPFTAPSEESVHLIESDPSNVIGQHYDLVLNGQEIAGGSIRIHDAELQQRIFTEVLGLKEDTFSYFIEALKSGCPPHGGIAFGLDRLVAILLGRNTIRDVIAFPKSTTGHDLMSDCPHELDVDVKKLYHL